MKKMRESMQLDENQYQLRFSDHNKTLYDKNIRGKKAQKILAVLKDHLGRLEHLKLLDVGSSTGIMTSILSENFAETIGIDIDAKALQYARENFENDRLRFDLQDSMNIAFPDASFDVVNCTHVYEHVPDSKRLMDEIFRVLRPGGVCYFAAGNKLVLMEAHYHLPFLSVIPKKLADPYIRFFKKADCYYEKHLTYWGLRRITSQFEIIDYTKKVIENPVRYSLTDMVKDHSVSRLFYLFVLKTAFWICPTYIWVLKKRHNTAF